MAELFQEIIRNTDHLKISARHIDDGEMVCAIDFDREMNILGESETFEVVLTRSEMEKLFDQLGDIINHDLRRY